MSTQTADRAARSTQTTAPTDRAFVGLLFGLAVLSAVGRGALELVVTKETAYAIQVGLTGLLVVALLLGRREARAHVGKLHAVIYLLLVVSFASAYVSALDGGFESAVTYVAVMTVFYMVFAAFSGLQFRSISEGAVLPWLCLAGVGLFAVAQLQQMGSLPWPLPGSDTASLAGKVRPSALTGSYLHYPLVMSLLFFVMLQAYSSKRRRIYGVLAAAFGLAVFLSYSRSGMMILLLGAGAYFLTSQHRGTRTKVLVLLGAVGLTAWVYRDTERIGRVLTATDASAVGNSARIENWERGIQLWLDSPIVIGSRTGEITNVSRNLGVGASDVVESGLLQQLINFGLLGAVLFYAVFAFTYLAIEPEHAVLRAGLLGAVLETLVYQSIEVFPFMVLLAMFPLVSRALQRQPLQARAAQEVARLRPGRTHLTLR